MWVDWALALLVYALADSILGQRGREWFQGPKKHYTEIFNVLMYTDILIRIHYLFFLFFFFFFLRSRFADKESRLKSVTAAVQRNKNVLRSHFIGSKTEQSFNAEIFSWLREQCWLFTPNMCTSTPSSLLRSDCGTLSHLRRRSQPLSMPSSANWEAGQSPWAKQTTRRSVCFRQFKK